MVSKKIFSIFIEIMILLSFSMTGLLPLSVFESANASETEAQNYWSFAGGEKDELPTKTLSDENYLYLLGWSESPSISKSINTLPKQDYESFFVHSFLSCFEKKTGKLIYSVMINGEDWDWANDMVMDEQYIYLVGNTSSDFLPKATNEKKGNSDGFITKIVKATGEILYSTYIGNLYEDEANIVIISKEGILVFGQSGTQEHDEIIRPPLYNNIFYSIIQPETGAIVLFNQYGGSHNEYLSDVVLYQSKVILVIESNSNDFPNGDNTSSSEWYKMVFLEIDEKKGDIFRNETLEGNEGAWVEKVHLDGQSLFLVGASQSSTLPGLNNTKICKKDIYTGKFDLETFTVVWTSYFGGNERSVHNHFLFTDHHIYISGITQATSLPKQTNKRVKASVKDRDVSVFVTKISKEDGSVEFSTFIDGASYIFDDQLLVKDDILYVLGETASEIISGALNKNHCASKQQGLWDGFITKINDSTGVIINSYLFGGKTWDFPKSFFIEQEMIYITGYSVFEPSETTPIISPVSGNCDLFVLSMKIDYDTYLESYEKFDILPKTITSLKYKLGTNLERSIYIYNIGTTGLDLTISTDVDWIKLETNTLHIQQPTEETTKIQIIDTLILNKENIGTITITSKKATIKVHVKIILEKEPGPTVEWEKDFFKLDKFSVFSAQTLAIQFQTTFSKDFPFKVSSENPWIEMEKSNGMISEKKISFKIVGSKLTPWQTNQGVIHIAFTDYPKLDKHIPVTVKAVGNIVKVMIGSDKVIFNDQEMMIEKASIPILKDNRTFIGIRFMGEIVFNNLATISFDAKTQTVYFELDSKKIELYIGKPYAMINGIKTSLEISPFIQEGRTFIPLRFVSESFDALVEYDSKKQMITITYPGKSS